ncbi:MAG TPA: hypothetical protein VIL70_08170, partial [Chthoniobacterales bacterium]
MSNDTAVLEALMETERPQASARSALLSGLSDGNVGDFPGWFRDQQRVGWAKFQELPKPARKDQAWR